MESTLRAFPKPWRRIPIGDGGQLVIDGEGKRICTIGGLPPEMRGFDHPTPEEALHLAGLVACLPDLLERPTGKKVDLVEPQIFVMQSGPHWHILRDAYGVLQKSRPFASRDAAVYACMVWYEAEPADLVVSIPHGAEATLAPMLESAGQAVVPVHESEPK